MASDQDYILLITDISGCYLRDSFYVTSPNPVSVTFDIDSITCSGFNNGAINTTTVGFSSFAEVLWYAKTPPILSGQWYLYSKMKILIVYLLELTLFKFLIQ